MENTIQNTTRESAISQAYRAANSENSSLKEDLVTEEVNSEPVVEDSAVEVIDENTEVTTDTAEEVNQVENKEESDEVVGNIDTVTDNTNEDLSNEEESQSTQPTDYDWSGDAKAKGWVSPDEKEEKLKEIHDEYQKQVEAVRKEPTENPLVNKLVELALNGKSIDMKFIQSQVIDYNDFNVMEKEDALKVIEMELAQSGEDEMGVKYKTKKYRDLFNGKYDETDEEYAELLEEIQYEATKSRQDLKKRQQEEKLPNVEKLTEEAIAKQEAESKRVLKVWETAVDKEVRETESVKFQLNKEDEFEYALSGDDKKEIQKILSEDFNFTRGFYKNGQFEFEEAIEAAAFRVPEIKGRILGKMASQFKSQGMDSLVSKQKNTQLEKSQPSKQEKISSEAQSVNSLFKNRYQKK